MNTAYPTTGPSNPFFELAFHSLNVLSPRLTFFDGGGPANPLIACEGSKALPRHEHPFVTCYSLAHILRQLVRGAI